MDIREFGGLLAEVAVVESRQSVSLVAMTWYLRVFTTISVVLCSPEGSTVEAKTILS